MKPSRKQTEPPMKKRLILGVLIAVVVFGVIAYKAFGQRPSSIPLVLDSGAVVTDQLTPNAPVAPAIGPALPPASNIATGNDPYPTNPTAQVDWVLRNNKPAMLLFHSTDCIPCKAMEQLVKKVRSDYEPHVVFVDVVTNDRANLGLIQQARIQAIPTTFFVSSSGQMSRVVGAMKEEALRAELATLRAGG
jgi:thiol:disulfide interchange protein